MAEGVFEHDAELGIDDQNLSLGMVEHEGDGGGVEARIDGVQHRAHHGHAVMGLKHGRRVGEHHRDGVAFADAASLQRRGELARTPAEVPVSDLLAPVDDCDMVRVDARRALKKDERRQRLIIRRSPVEACVEWVDHAPP